MTPKKVERYGFTEYRTKELGRSGISLVIAYKKSIEGGSLSNTFRRIWDSIRGRNQARVAVDVPVAPANPIAYSPAIGFSPPEDAEFAEAEQVVSDVYATDDIEDYYTPKARKIEKQLIQKVKSLDADLREARNMLSIFGNFSLEGSNPDFHINKVNKIQRDLYKAEDRLREFQSMLQYLPLRNRPTDGNTVLFDRNRAEIFPYDFTDINDTADTTRPLDILELGGIVLTDAEIAQQMEDDAERRANMGMADAPMVEKPERYDLSTFGDREARRLADAERIYNETMDEEIEKQGMSREDRPRGSGIYMKGFGRMTGGLVPQYPYAPLPIPSQQMIDDYPDLFPEEVAIQEYNDYIDFLEDEQKAMENYLWQDLNRLDAGIIQVPNREATTNLLFQKIDNIDRIRSELDDILDENQTMEVAELVKAYMDEYIEIDKPFVDIADWRGGVLLE
jgi:hypothetical protein